MVGERGNGASNGVNTKKRMGRPPITGTIVNVLFVKRPVASVRSGIVKGGKAEGNTLPSGLTAVILST